jgi:hypothetical protein
VIWTHLRPAHVAIGPVPVLGIGWALLVVAAIGVSTLSIVRLAGRLELSATVLRIEGGLAVGLTLAMCAVLGGTVAWWIAVDAHAPDFVSSSAAGLFDAPGTLSLGAAGSLMAVGLAVGLWGDTRLLRALHALDR